MNDTMQPGADDLVRAWTLMVRLGPRFLAATEAALKEAGLPPLDWYDALIALRRAGDGGLRAYALGEATGLPQYAVSRLAERMARGGALTRRRCREDGRGQVLVITDKGRALVNRMFAVHRSAVRDQIGARLAPAGAAALVRLLAPLDPPPAAVRPAAEQAQAPAPTPPPARKEAAPALPRRETILPAAPRAVAGGREMPLAARKSDGEESTMELTGSKLIAADRAKVWAALNDPEILKATIPGCTELTKTDDTHLEASVTAKVGPVKATFKGAVELTELNPPESYVLVGEGKGGVAGFAKGHAKVVLTEVEGGTELTYTAEAKVGGKLAQLGSRIIDGFARRMADDFFTRFQEAVGAPAPAPAEAEPEPDAAPEGGDTPEGGEKKGFFKRLFG